MGGPGSGPKVFLWVIQGDSVRGYFDRHVNFSLIGVH